MSRVGKLIQSLETLHQEEIKHSAKVFGIAATLSARLQELLDNNEKSYPRLTSEKITQADVISRYGNFNNAYAIYKKAYGIKCRRNWSTFLNAIEGLTPPETVEDRLTKLEKTVQLLVEILLTEQDN